MKLVNWSKRQAVELGIWARARLPNITILIAIGLLIGTGIVLTRTSIEEHKRITVESRLCMLQLIVGGEYSKNPDCQYPRPDYDSVTDELASLSLVNACILRLHAAENLPVPIENIEACARDGSVSSLLRIPGPQPNQAPASGSQADPGGSQDRTSRESGGGGGNGDQNDPSLQGTVRSVADCVFSPLRCIGGTIRDDGS